VRGKTFSVRAKALWLSVKIKIKDKGVDMGWNTLEMNE
jgi:hypothetical protein